MKVVAIDGSSCPGAAGWGTGARHGCGRRIRRQFDLLQVAEAPQELALAIASRCSASLRRGKLAIAECGRDIGQIVLESRGDDAIVPGAIAGIPFPGIV